MPFHFSWVFLKTCLDGASLTPRKIHNCSDQEHLFECEMNCLKSLYSVRPMAHLAQDCLTRSNSPGSLVLREPEIFSVGDTRTRLFDMHWNPCAGPLDYRSFPECPFSLDLADGHWVCCSGQGAPTYREVLRKEAAEEQVEWQTFEERWDWKKLRNKKRKHWVVSEVANGQEEIRWVEGNICSWSENRVWEWLENGARNWQNVDG